VRRRREDLADIAAHAIVSDGDLSEIISVPDVKTYRTCLGVLDDIHQKLPDDSS
jgi:hypothetical protein